MNILFEDNNLIICIKPIGILSQRDESGNENMMDLLDKHFADNNSKCKSYVVHRLDKSVGGIMVYAKDSKTAGKLSAAISERNFTKEYMAVINGVPLEPAATLKDFLFKDSRKNKSFVVKKMRKGVKEASLEYKLLGTHESKYGEISLVRILLHTGRTHQIRVQFASRKMPLLGDGKYGSRDSNTDIALWSYRLAFKHPITNKMLDYAVNVPSDYPWNLFN